MQRQVTVATSRDPAKQKAMGSMSIGIELGERRSHFCVSNDQGQEISRPFGFAVVQTMKRDTWEGKLCALGFRCCA